ILGFVLGHDVEPAWCARFAAAPRELVDEVLGRAVDDRVGGIEAKPVEVVVEEPVENVRAHELTHGRRIRPIEVEAAAPVTVVAREVGVAELVQHAADWSDVVVDDVDDYGEAGGVCRIDESPGIVRRTVVMKGRKEENAVIAP